jgi:hypothetical protein
MYDGWLTTFGTEVVNAARLHAYQSALLPGLPLRDCTECYDLTAAVEDDPYTTPTADDAPWVDVDTPDSGLFIGFMANTLTGFEDSTRTAPVIESLFDGGTVGRTRRNSREMRVVLTGFGQTHAAVMAGLAWLKSALNGNLCNTCDDSDDVCFFTACPPPGADADAFIRHLRRVKCTAGPTVLIEREMNSCGAWMVQVEFTLVAGSPFIYGEPNDVAYATGSELTAVHPDADVFPLTHPIESCWSWLDKPKSVLLRDPDCPPVPPPPTAPAITEACKPVVFSGYSYYPSADSGRKNVVVALPGYSARPVLAQKAGTWVTAYSQNSVSGITASSVIKGKVSTTSGTTWGAEYTVYDEGSGTRGLEPAGMTYAADLDKFILGVNNRDLSSGKMRGEILTSATGLSGSWSVIANLDAVMSGWGASSYYLTDVEHHENGTPGGIMYAAVHAMRRKIGTTPATVKPVAVILRSFDGGVTWQVLSLPWGASTVNSYTYPQLALWPTGEIGVLVNVPENRQIFWKRSTTGGSSWTAGVVAATAAGGIPAPVITNDGGVMFLYRDTRDPGSTGLGRFNYRWSKDHGRRWFAGTNFTKSTGGMQGGDWAVGSTGDLGVVFGLAYSSTDANVYWNTFWQKENYLSYAIYVPDSALRAWADGVLMLQIRTGARASRNMRIRFIPRPLPDQMPEDLDPCSVCSEFTIDYAPANTLVYIDGMTERVTMRVGNGVPQPADHLVSGPSGGIFSWPTFTCGLGYFVIVDVDVATVTSLALAVANRE